MNLAPLHDRHPLAIGLAGAASGFTGLLLDHMAGINGFVAFIGTVAGTLAACITLLFKIMDWRERRRMSSPVLPRHPRDWESDDLPW